MIRYALSFGLVAAASALALSPAAAGAAQESGCQGPAGSAKLYVNVDGLRSAKGLIAVTVYADDKSRFLAKKGSLFVARVDAHAPRTRVCVNLPKPATYAIAVYHDEDGNRHFKRNFVGMPQEGFGFSNNPSTFFGLPAFSAVRLANSHATNETTITLRYP